jgi:hypothetical protein
MSDNIAIITSKERLTSDDLRAAVLKAGGYRDPDGRTGHLSGERSGHIWVHLDHETIETTALENPQKMDQIRQKLGGEPHACLGVEIDQAPGSQKLAIAFASLCAGLWPCVVDTLKVEAQVFSKEEIMRIQKEGKVFSDYYK